MANNAHAAISGTYGNISQKLKLRETSTVMSAVQNMFQYANIAILNTKTRTWKQSVTNFCVQFALKMSVTKMKRKKNERDYLKLKKQRWNYRLTNNLYSVCNLNSIH